MSTFSGNYIKMISLNKAAYDTELQMTLLIWINWRSWFKSIMLSKNDWMHNSILQKRKKFGLCDNIPKVCLHIQVIYLDEYNKVLHKFNDVSWEWQISNPLSSRLRPQFQIVLYLKLQSSKGLNQQWVSPQLPNGAILDQEKKESYKLQETKRQLFGKFFGPTCAKQGHQKHYDWNSM